MKALQLDKQSRRSTKRLKGMTLMEGVVTLALVPVLFAIVSLMFRVLAKPLRTDPSETLTVVRGLIHLRNTIQNCELILLPSKSSRTKSRRTHLILINDQGQLVHIYAQDNHMTFITLQPDNPNQNRTSLFPGLKAGASLGPPKCRPTK